MTRYVWNGSTFVRADWHPPAPSRAPGIIRDHMEPVQHPCTGQILDSKSAFRAITRENGCVELGNDAPCTAKPVELDPKQRRADIATAIEQVEQGYRPPEIETAAPDVRIYGK